MKSSYWKRFACACLTVGKHKQMLHTGFFDSFPPAIREEEIAISKGILEEVYSEYPKLREWMG